MTDQNSLFEARGPVNMPRSNKPNTSNLSNDSSLREAARKSLLKDINGKDDINENDNVIYTSEELAKIIEEEVFEITGKNCKNNKLYREKIHKYLHNRLTGTKNSFIRIALFNGKLSVKDLCVLSHNQLEDDDYFNKLLGKSDNIPSKINRTPFLNVHHKPIIQVNGNQTDTNQHTEVNNLVEDYFNQESSLKNEQINTFQSYNIENNEHRNYFDEETFTSNKNVTEDNSQKFNVNNDNHNINLISDSNKENEDSNFPKHESQVEEKKDEAFNQENKNYLDNNNFDNISDLQILKDKNSALFRENSELKINSIKLEKDIEIERNQIRLYVEEVKALRETNTELRLKLSNINEESHQLDIQKLTNNLLIKDKEIILLEKEKAALREQLNNYERYFKNIFEKYRSNEDHESSVQSKNVNYKQDSIQLNEEEKYKQKESLEHNENPKVENNNNVYSTNINYVENTDNKLSEYVLENNTNEVKNNFEKRERTNSHLSANDNKENTKNNERVENLNERKVILLPPKVSESYKIQTKHNSSTLSNRVSPRINPPKLTYKQNKNEEKLPSIINTIPSSSNPLFEEEPQIDSNQLFASETQSSQIISNITHNKEELNSINKQEENYSSIKGNIEPNVVETQLKERNDQGVISEEKQSPITTKTNNFFDEDENTNDFLNNSHVQSTSNSKPLNNNPKVLTPNRDVKKTLTPSNPPINVTQSNTEKTNNFFDDGDDTSNNLFSSNNQLINSNKNRINIPHNKVIATNRVNLPFNKKIEKPINPNTSTITNDPKKDNEKKLNQVSNIQDPFNFHQANENDFDNIFDSLSSSSVSKQKNENKNKKNNYFDD